MIRYLEAIEQLPMELKLPLMKAFELFREEIAETVKRSDFEELKAIVRELIEAQKKSEERIAGLERVVGELAEAQKRTEQRVEELAEAQRETQKEVSRLDRALQELAEAQRRTEQRVEELAEAQKRTEEELQWLVKSHKELREEVGGLAHTVGYRLEDESYKALPALLKKEMGIEVIGRLKRDFLEIGKERYIEVNIWGEGRSNGKEYVIIGEAKSQLKKSNINEFIKKAEAVSKYIPKEQVRILVTYHTSPQVLRYAREKNIKVYFSYEF